MTQPELDFARPVPRDAAAETRYRNTKAGQLREILSDARWHEGVELSARVGHRFGAAIERIAKGLDGGAFWEIKRERLSADGARWRYRWTGNVLGAAQHVSPRPNCCPNCGASL